MTEFNNITFILVIIQIFSAFKLVHKEREITLF